MPFNVTHYRVRSVMAVAAVAVLLLVLWEARSALTPFFIGALFVLIFAPAADHVARRLPFHHRHPDLALSLSILFVYLFVGGGLALVLVLLVPRTLGEARSLANGLPSFVERAKFELQDNNGWYLRNVPIAVRTQIDANWQQVGNKAAGLGEQLVNRTLNFATTSLATVVSYIVVPFWAFFVLKDRQKFYDFLLGLFPAQLQPDIGYLVGNAHTVFGSYLRAQIILSTFTGVVTGVGLALMGVQFAAVLGVIAGVANLIPVIGPLAGGVPAIVVVAATRPGLTVLWVFLFLFVAQELKDFIVVPRIQGKAVRMHPAVILVLIVVGGHLAGFWGLLLSVPLGAVLRDSFVYVYRRVGQNAEIVLTDASPVEVGAALSAAAAGSAPLVARTAPAGEH